MRKTIAIFLLLLCMVSVEAQEKETMTLTFVGDVMGHDTQIEAAYVDSTDRYDYDFMFQKIRPLFEKDDFTIANLEVTLAGKPYRGYPRFGSPDELASACKRNGVDVFVTANNHSCDRGRKGVVRTLDVLDSLQIPHTGTFRDSIDRSKNNLLILEKGNMKVGVLNYTYGTNGIAIPKPTVVNLLDTAIIRSDIEQARMYNLDKLIAVTHWGYEYKFHPHRSQIDMTQFLYNNGVDVVIGGHPHVVQRCEYHPQTDFREENLVVYSLGNFVSNMRSKGCDGGIVVSMTLSKEEGQTKIVDPQHHLIWVHKPVVEGKSRFQVLHATEMESSHFSGLNTSSVIKAKEFIARSRTLFDSENIGFTEGRFPLNLNLQYIEVVVPKVVATDSVQLELVLPFIEHN